MKEPILLTIDVVDEMSAGMAGALANLPTTHAMQAKHLSGASIGKLVEYDSGRSLITNEHQWSQAFVLRGLTHSRTEVELEAYGGNYGLKPDDWVRVTQVPAGQEAA